MAARDITTVTDSTIVLNAYERVKWRSFVLGISTLIFAFLAAFNCSRGLEIQGQMYQYRDQCDGMQQERLDAVEEFVRHIRNQDMKEFRRRGGVR